MQIIGSIKNFQSKKSPLRRAFCFRRFAEGCTAISLIFNGFQVSYPENDYENALILFRKNGMEAYETPGCLYTDLIDSVCRRKGKFGRNISFKGYQSFSSFRAEHIENLDRN